MKRKHLLILMLLALMMPLAVNAQSSLPFTENFNSVPVDQLPTDWVLSSTQVGTVTAVVQKETPTSTNRLLLMAVTQLKNGNGALAVQIPGNAIGKRYVKLTFKLMPTNANSGTFKVVCASTSFTNPIEVATYNASDLTVGDWNYITTPVTLSSSKTITFMVTTTTANTGWAIDDVSVTDGYKPTNVTTSVLEPNYATISWNYSGASTYEMQYRMQGETDWTTVTTASNHYAISELLTNTTYEAQVRGKEGTFSSGWSDMLTFTTPDAFYNFYIAIQNSDRYLYYKVTDSENHYVTVVPPFNSFGDPWGTFAKPEGNVIIPQTVTYGGVTYTVTDIGNYALKGCTGVTGISIPSTITSIGNYAFYNCKLTSLVIPSSVTEINQYAFNNCGNDNGMTVNIAGDATTGTRIETMAFMNSKVNELTLGEGVVFVGEKAFWGCPLLTTVHFNATNCTQMYSTYNSAYYSVFNSGSDNTTHPAITTLTIGNNVTNIPDYAFYDFASLSEVTISQGVTSIGNQAFWSCPNLTTVNFNATNCTSMHTVYENGGVNYYCSAFNSGTDNTTSPAITTLTIGNNVTRIPASAFENASQISNLLTIPSSVQSIGGQAFRSCSGIPNLIFEEGSQQISIGQEAFRYCSGMSNLSWPSSLTTLGIGSYAFADCNLSSVSIPSSAGSISTYAFRNCGHSQGMNVDIASNAYSQTTTIGPAAFYGSTVSELTIGAGVRSIGDGAFWNCPHLTTVHFNAINCTQMSTTVTNSDDTYYRSVFNSGEDETTYPAITTLTIGNNVINIPAYAFYGCTLLPSVTIGESVNSIGEQAFWNCPLLKTVHFNAANCTQMNTTYTNGDDTYYRSVFNSGEDETTYPAITNLSIGPYVAHIPQYAFFAAHDISSPLIISQRIRVIGERAFEGCSSIPSIEFAGGSELYNIQREAFMGCSSMTSSLNLPNGLITIGWNAFRGCKFTTVSIPSSTTTIGSMSFLNCGSPSGMVVVIEGNTASETTIADHAFYGSTVKELTIGKGVTSIDDKAFWNCPLLTTVHFNAINCTSMQTTYNDGENTYYRSVFNRGNDLTTGPAITTLTIGNEVTYIPQYAFIGAHDISNPLIIPERIRIIDERAFKSCSSIPSIEFSEGSEVYRIQREAFFGCSSMTGSLILPNGLVTIGSDAFRECKFTTVNIPSSTTTIGTHSFLNCGSPSGMVVVIEGNTESGTTVIGNAFYGSTVKELTIGEGVTTIEGRAFWNCPLLTTVHFNATYCTNMMTTYTDSNGNNYQCSAFNSGEDLTTGPVITTLTIGENVTNIPGYAFYDCQTAPVKLNIPNVTAVGDGAFYNCMLATDLKLGNSVVTIGMKAFENCNNITGDLIIPNTTTFIGASAFCDAGLNGMLVLGQNVNSLGAAAFKNCNFTSIIIGRGNVSEPNNITTAEANTFEGVRSYIPVYRPFGTNYPTATGWNHFTNYLTEYQLNGGAWSVASNWLQNSVPGADDVVLINGNSHISSNTSPAVKSLYIANGDAKTLKIYDGAMLTVTDGIYNTDPSKLIVNDGGQLITPKVTAATVERKTSASEAKTYNNWYAIASPVNEESIEDFVKGTHNVYRYNEPTIMWQEYRVPVNQFSKLTNGQGYLYRSTEANIALDGDINVGDVKVWLSKECSNTRYQGFNLIGNPYPHNIYKGASNAAIPNGDLLEDKYCVLGVNGNWILTDDGTAIKPGTAILVQAKESGNLTMHDVTTSGTAKRTENDKIWFTVSNSDYEDVACVEFREGRGFNKMAHYNEDAPMLYINYNGEDFASIDMNENIHIIDLCFKAKTMGQYTLKLNANGNISYLHLIDRLTGNDVDMLVEDEYSFIGMAGDNANRFIVKLDANSDGADDNFVYQNGDDIVVSGEGELQVFDVMGRMIASRRVNGVETMRKPDQTGVYIYKMNEKTQKIVVR